MGKPTIERGPASNYEADNEVIREVTGQNGTGFLLSVRNLDDGTVLVDVYRADDNVRVLHASH
jgi:hypothetical protein